jgi:hypothetical protein
MTVKEVNFWYWLVDKLPNKLVYFCFLRVWNHATTGEYGSTLADKITCGSAVTRYSKDNNIEF